MGTVLWLLYLADVVGSLNAILGYVCFIALTYAAAVRVHAAIEDEEPPAVKPALIVALAAALVASIIPSKTTIYAVAAVTAGDKALQTETGSKAIQALNAWLDEQIRKSDEKRH